MARRPPKDAYYTGADHYPSASSRPLRSMPAQPNDQSGVILVTAGYDHTIKFWEALSGICSRTIQHPDSVVLLQATNDSKKIASPFPLTNISSPQLAINMSVSTIACPRIPIPCYPLTDTRLMSRVLHSTVT